ncbi:MAG: HAD family hydrolase, partial [Janthinobacterium lividum]
MTGLPSTLRKPRAILFDLDGTLADTAPDLAAAVNLLRQVRGLAPAPYAQLRPFASAGARGLIGAAFGLKPGDDGYEDLRVAF